MNDHLRGLTAGFDRREFLKVTGAGLAAVIIAFLLVQRFWQGGLSAGSVK